MRLFYSGTNKADRDYHQGDSVEGFISALSFEWNARILLNRTNELRRFLDFFMKAAHPR